MAAAIEAMPIVPGATTIARRGPHPAPGMVGLMIRTSIETAATHWPGLRAIAEG